MKSMLLLTNQSCISYAGAVDIDAHKYIVHSGYRLGASHIDIYDMLVGHDDSMCDVNMYKLPEPVMIDAKDVMHAYDIDDSAVAKLSEIYDYRHEQI